MSFRVHQPESVAEAVRLAGDFGPEARWLAGGTDLIIQINRKLCAPRHLIALDRIAELRGITFGENEVWIGALMTHRTIEQSVTASDHSLAALAEAARVIGGHQVRNVGTVGGNVANASPAADLLPVLLTLDAEVVLTGGKVTRRVPLAKFLCGPGATDRSDGELLLRIGFPRPASNGATAFIKAGRRRAMEISIVCVAALLELDQGGRCRTVRIGMGAVAPTALRATAAEHALQGHAPTEAALRDAGRLAAAACAPISDVRASAEYRRMLVQALVPRVLRRCLERVKASAA